MLHMALCDDDSQFREHLSEQVMQYMEKRSLQCEVSAFSCGEDLLESDLDRYDLIFLDYKMPGLNGMETARRIRERNILVLIVFVSTFARYAVDGYSLHVLRYVLKDRLEHDLPESLDAACMALKIESEQFIVNIRGRDVSIAMDDILYLESYGRKINIHMCSPSDQYEYYGKIGDEEQRLSTFGFLRTHQSYLVNLDHIIAFDETSVLLDNGFRVPVSRSREKEVARWVKIYLD